MNATASDPSFAMDFVATEATVRDALSEVRARLTERGFAADSCGTVELVLAEALNNIVEHAYAEAGEGKVILEMHQGSDRLSFHLRDVGHPLPGLTLPVARLPRRDVPVADLPEGGFGWYLIHTLTAALSYTREDHENRLFFEIETTPRPAA